MIDMINVEAETEIMTEGTIIIIMIGFKITVDEEMATVQPMIETMVTLTTNNFKIKTKTTATNKTKATEPSEMIKQ